MDWAWGKMPPPPAAASPVLDSPRSPALQIIGKMKETLEGRVVGILVGDGTDASLLATVRSAVTAERGRTMIIAASVGGVTLSDDSCLPADGQLAGTPSVLFDAIVVLLTRERAAKLARDCAALEFVRDAYAHLKAIGVDDGGRALLRAAGIAGDDAVVAVNDCTAFIAAAMTRQWDREATVRTLA